MIISRQFLPVPIYISLVDLQTEECLHEVSTRKFVELRLDRLPLSAATLSQALKQKAGSVIVAIRNQQYRSHANQVLIQAALEHEADYIDLEYADFEEATNLIPDLKYKNIQLICSYHNFDTTPDKVALEQIITRSLALGATYVKLAPFVDTPEKSETLLSLLSEHDNLVIVALGPLGLSTRIEAAYRGSKFIYAALDEAHRAAPSQPTEPELLNYIQKNMPSKRTAS